MCRLPTRDKRLCSCLAFRRLYWVLMCFLGFGNTVAGETLRVLGPPLIFPPFPFRLMNTMYNVPLYLACNFWCFCSFLCLMATVACPVASPAPFRLYILRAGLQHLPFRYCSAALRILRLQDMQATCINIPIAIPAFCSFTIRGADSHVRVVLPVQVRVLI